MSNMFRKGELIKFKDDVVCTGEYDDTGDEYYYVSNGNTECYLYLYNDDNEYFYTDVFRDQRKLIIMFDDIEYPDNPTEGDMWFKIFTSMKNIEKDEYTLYCFKGLSPDLFERVDVGLISEGLIWE